LRRGVYSEAPPEFDLQNFMDFPGMPNYKKKVS
jgi:hypothetical protein